MATTGDAERLAELHMTRIVEGFLSSLGPRFLTRLYRRIVRSPEGFAIVALDGTDIVGFSAGVVDLGRLYRSFLVRDGLVTAVIAAPRLLRSWRRVLETLRYRTPEVDLPVAEVLAVAVDESSGQRGVGYRLVIATLDEFVRRNTTTAKVVAGAGNTAALALYRRCGFFSHSLVAVHAGRPSEVLVWSSS